MKMNIHFLRHVPFEGPGVIASRAEARGFECASTNLNQHQELPDPDEEFALGLQFHLKTKPESVWAPVEPCGSELEKGRPFIRPAGALFEKEKFFYDAKRTIFTLLDRFVEM